MVEREWRRRQLPPVQKWEVTAFWVLLGFLFLIVLTLLLLL